MLIDLLSGDRPRAQWEGLAPDQRSHAFSAKTDVGEEQGPLVDIGCRYAETRSGGFLCVDLTEPPHPRISQVGL